MAGLLTLAACSGENQPIPPGEPAAEATHSPEVEQPSTKPVDKDCTWHIASIAPLSRDSGVLGRGFERGVRLAAAVANADPEIACKLKIVSRDTRGSEDHAWVIAPKVAAKKRLVACVCGHFSTELWAIGRFFEREGILITGVAQYPGTTRMGFDTWFQAAASSKVEAELAALHMTEGLGAEEVAIIDTVGPYDGIISLWGAFGNETEHRTFMLLRKGRNSSPWVAEKVAMEDPDVVYFDGYTPAATVFVQDLREAGFEKTFYGSAGMKDSTYADAGDAAIDTMVACACIDAARTPAAAAFADLHRERYGEVPGVMAAELFDVTTFVADALRGLDGDEPISEVRERVVTFFDEAKRVEGIAKTYSWNARGGLTGRLDDIVIYEWSDEQITFVPLGTIEELLGDAS